MVIKYEEDGLLIAILKYNMYKLQLTEWVHLTLCRTFCCWNSGEISVNPWTT